MTETDKLPATNQILNTVISWREDYNRPATLRQYLASDYPYIALELGVWTGGIKQKIKPIEDLSMKDWQNITYESLFRELKKFPLRDRRLSEGVVFDLMVKMRQVKENTDLGQELISKYLDDAKAITYMALSGKLRKATVDDYRAQIPLDPA